MSQTPLPNPSHSPSEPADAALQAFIADPGSPSARAAFACAAKQAPEFCPAAALACAASSDASLKSALEAFPSMGLAMAGADRRKRTALHFACQKGFEVSAAILLSACPESAGACDFWGHTPLHRAAEADMPALCAALLAAGSDPLLVQHDGLNPFFFACAKGCAKSAQALLLARPDCARGYDIRGQDAVAICAEAGLDGLLKALLYSGANPDSRDAAGQTPLMAACLAGREECAKILLAAGSDPAALDRNGCNALMHAAAGPGGACCGLLLAMGPPGLCKTQSLAHKHTALMIAAAKNNPGACAALAPHSDLTLRAAGRTAFELALSRNRLECAAAIASFMDPQLAHDTAAREGADLQAFRAAVARRESEALLRQIPGAVPCAKAPGL